MIDNGSWWILFSLSISSRGQVRDNVGLLHERLVNSKTSFVLLLEGIDKRNKIIDERTRNSFDTDAVEWLV